MTMDYNKIPMDYNKVGIFHGIIGLLLLVPPILSRFTGGELGDFLYFFVGIPSTFFSLYYGITALVLGKNSIKKGNKEKTALVIGLAYILFLISVIILIYGRYILYSLGIIHGGKMYFF